MRLVLFTQNEAPFRMKWMDELSKYVDVQIYHIGEYDGDVNQKYISYHVSNAQIANIAKKFLSNTIYDTQKIRLNKDDIILLDGYGFLAQQILVLYLKLHRFRYGISVDGAFIPVKEANIKKRVKEFIIKNASFFLSTSETTDEFLIHYGAKKECIYRHLFSNIESGEILEHPCDDGEKRKIRASLGLDDKFTIISVGKIIHRKGFDILDEALATIEDDIQVLIIGANEDDNTVFLDKRIKLLSFMDKKMLSEYFRASDIFVLPTREDVWGLVVGEAMANGLPVVTTTRCLAGVEMVKNGMNGFIVPVEDSKGLADAIRRCMNMNITKAGNISISIIKDYSIDNAVKLDFRNFKRIRERVYEK